MQGERKGFNGKYKIQPQQELCMNMNTFFFSLYGEFSPIRKNPNLFNAAENLKPDSWTTSLHSTLVPLLPFLAGHNVAVCKKSKNAHQR